MLASILVILCLHYALASYVPYFDQPLPIHSENATVDLKNPKPVNLSCTFNTTDEIIFASFKDLNNSKLVFYTDSMTTVYALSSKYNGTFKKNHDMTTIIWELPHPTWINVGCYYCEAFTASTGNQQQQVCLYHFAHPTVTTRQVTNGSHTSLTCTATAYPEPSVSISTYPPFSLSTLQMPSTFTDGIMTTTVVSSIHESQAEGRSVFCNVTYNNVVIAREFHFDFHHGSNPFSPHKHWGLYLSLCFVLIIVIGLIIYWAKKKYSPLPSYTDHHLSESEDCLKNPGYDV